MVKWSRKLLLHLFQHRKGKKWQPHSAQELCKDGKWTKMNRETYFYNPSKQLKRGFTPLTVCLTIGITYLLQPLMNYVKYCVTTTADTLIVLKYELKKCLEIIGDFAIHFYVHKEKKPFTCKVGMFGIYAYIYYINLIIFYSYVLHLLQMKNKSLDILCCYN